MEVILQLDLVLFLLFFIREPKWINATSERKREKIEKMLKFFLHKNEKQRWIY